VKDVAQAMRLFTTKLILYQRVLSPARNTFQTSLFLTRKKYETNFLFLAISSSFYPNADCLRAVLKNTEMLRIQKFHRNS